MRGPAAVASKRARRRSATNILDKKSIRPDTSNPLPCDATVTNTPSLRTHAERLGGAPPPRARGQPHLPRLAGDDFSRGWVAGQACRRHVSAEAESAAWKLKFEKQALEACTAARSGRRSAVASCPYHQRDPSPPPPTLLVDEVGVEVGHQLPRLAVYFDDEVAGCVQIERPLGQLVVQRGVPPRHLCRRRRVLGRRRSRCWDTGAPLLAP